MPAKKIIVTVGAHADSVAGWLGSYGGEESPNDIQRGIFASEVGIPRLVTLFERQQIPATWFLPGHTIESFPAQMELIANSGAEVACHGYSHENPVAMSKDQERDVLSKSVELVEAMTGRRPRGYVAPWWEMSKSTAQLLIEEGFSYDNSQSYHDFLPFYARVGDSWTNVDYDKPASSWMRPLVRGGAVDLVEFAANWYVDDLPPMMFIKNSANSHGYVAPQVIEQLWKDQFDWVYREMDYAVFPVTIHPDVSGRPQVLMMLERFFDYIKQREGVELMTFEDAATDFRLRTPFDASLAAPI